MKQFNRFKAIGDIEFNPKPNPNLNPNVNPIELSITGQRSDRSQRSITETFLSSFMASIAICHESKGGG